MANTDTTTKIKKSDWCQQHVTEIIETILPPYFNTGISRNVIIANAIDITDKLADGLILKNWIAPD
jgi:hypothetical protein